MFSVRVLISAVLCILPFAQGMASSGDCYKDKTGWGSCYNAVTAQCATLQGGPYTTCACATASSLWSCYTSYCTSDKYYSNYYGGVTTCAQLGIGTAPAGAPAGATTTSSTISSGSSPTATGHSAGAMARPPTASGDILLFTAIALFWVGGLGLMFL